MCYAAAAIRAASLRAAAKPEETFHSRVWRGPVYSLTVGAYPVPHRTTMRRPSFAVMVCDLAVIALPSSVVDVLL